MHKLWNRLQREEGFTLIELLVVIVIIGILLAIAVPSYLGFRDRASDSAAQANIRAAVPSAEAYFADNGNYTHGSWIDCRPEGDLRQRPQDRSAGTPRGQARRRDAAATATASRQTGQGRRHTQFHFTGPGGEVSHGGCSYSDA